MRVFLDNIKLRKTTSLCVAEGKIKPMSNIKNIFTTSTTPANHEEGQAEEDFNENAENEFVQFSNFNSRLVSRS